MEQKYILSVLVRNQYGVLTRVAGLFARRGYNIDSLSVGETEDPAVSRMTVVSTCDAPTRDQMMQQLLKLHDVISVSHLPRDAAVTRELLLLKLLAPEDSRSSILEAAGVFRAKVIDLSPSSITLELTGDSSKIDAFITFMRQYSVAELCRTGLTAMSR